MDLHGGYDGMEARPMRSRPKPEPGEEIIDEAFGTRVTRITHAIPYDGELAVIKPMYSTVPAWSPDERYLLLWSRAHGHLIYQGDRPYRYLGPLTPYHPTDIESVCWGPSTGTYEWFYPSNYNALPRYMRQSWRPGLPSRISLVRDFATRPTSFPEGDWEKLLSLGGDPQALSRGPLLQVGLKCGQTTFTYSIRDDDVSNLVDLPTDWQNAVMPSPSERWAQLGRLVLSPRMHLRRVLRMDDAFEHACPGLQVVGGDVEDTWNMVDFGAEASLVSYWLDTGASHVVIGTATGYPYPPSDTHLSALGPANLVALGIVGSGQGQSLLDNECVLADVETGQVLRVGHLRTLADEGPWGYWSESHVVISPSGTRILFASDWGGSATVDTYVVDLRPTQPPELEDEKQLVPPEVEV